MKNISPKQIVVGFLIIVCMTFMNMCNTCSTKKNTVKIFKENDSLQKEILMLREDINTLEKTCVSKIDLQIEGLKSEARAIEASDRKILDIERAAMIRKEIQELEKKNK